MRRFLQDTRGSAILWTLFLILILFTLTALIYTGVTVYAKYQTCETELQCASTITVDAELVNANVRDLQLNVPKDAAQSLEDNLTETGWTQEEGCWIKRDSGKIIYGLEDIQLTAEGKTMRIDGTFVMPSSWTVGGISEIRIPMTVLSTVLYIE
jgi:hypothetical protein